MDHITITCGEISIVDCSCVIIVPEKALEEPGYIKGLTVNKGAHDKHEFQALAQMAYFQHQDDELELMEMQAPCSVLESAEKQEMTDGMVIYRLQDGSIGAAVSQGLNTRKLLEAANRFCTRWVRLDI